MAHEHLSALISPDQNGFFGQHGGEIEHPQLKAAMQEIHTALSCVVNTAEVIKVVQSVIFRWCCISIN